MIILTRLGGHTVAVNPDLIERAEATPDTVLTMIDGHKIVIVESVDEVVELVRAWRATVAARAYALGTATQATGLQHEPDPDDVRRSKLRHPSAYGSARAATGDGGQDVFEDHVAIDASLARVLRLPQRGE